MKLGELSHQELLHLFAQVGDELRARGLSRSANSPVADLAEALVAEALGLRLATNSTAGFDAKGQGKKYQVKGRRQSGKKWPPHFGVLRGLPKRDFDFLAGVVFTPDFDIAEATLLPYDAVARLAVFNKHQNGHILGVRAACEAPEAEDITVKVRHAWSALPQRLRAAPKAAR